jgi:DNA-binding transcriptional regulator PaaX
MTPGNDPGRPMAGSAGRRQDVPMEDPSILTQIHSLVEAERELQGREVHTPDDRARLRELEESLDQCWDLLRQRRAHREFGQDPDDAQVRPTRQVEGYLQ